MGNLGDDYQSGFDSRAQNVATVSSEGLAREGSASKLLSRLLMGLSFFVYC